MSFSCMIEYRTTTTQYSLFGQFLEEFFSETQLTLRAKKVVRLLPKHAGSREALPAQ